MKIGDIVRVDKCEACEAAVGKTAKIRCFLDSIISVEHGESKLVVLNFGKGRPQLGRPHSFPVADLTNMSDPVAEVHV